MRPIARIAWGLLAYEVAVIGWGAYVRATGSGAGCGRHWPLCTGEVIPRSPRVETLIEFSHRVSSGAALVLTLALLVGTLRVYPRGHRVRRAAGATTALMVTEGLIGASLVLFRLVGHDTSLTRALTMCLHLVNTFVLLASTSLTAWWASGGEPLRIRGQGALVPALGLPLVAMLLVGTTGAVNALGDTLFPSSSVALGLAQDFAAGAPAFVHLRVLHPLLAVGTAALILGAMTLVRALRPSRVVHFLSRAAGLLAVTQVAVGLLDMVLLAPVVLQLVHLALADLVWIALVLSSAAALSAASEPLKPAVFPPSRPLLR